MNVVLRTFDDTDGEIIYTYEIVYQENKNEEMEYVVYRHTGPLINQVRGHYDTFVDAVKGLYDSMKNE